LQETWQNFLKLKVYICDLELSHTHFNDGITSTAFWTASIAVGLLLKRKPVSDVIWNADGFLCLSKP